MDRFSVRHRGTLHLARSCPGFQSLESFPSRRGHRRAETCRKCVQELFLSLSESLDHLQPEHYRRNIGRNYQRLFHEQRLLECSDTSNRQRWQRFSELRNGRSGFGSRRDEQHFERVAVVQHELCFRRISLNGLYTGSYDGGGPTACHVYSNNQERHSVYELFIQTGTTNEYTITGGELIQQTINGVESTTFVVLVSTTHSANFESGDVTDCAEVLNPISRPALRWYVRTPPVSGNITGATLTGNFGITGTMGAAMVPAATTNALIFEQFVNRTFQTGYIPNQGCATCISILGSQDPVSGNSANWPG